MKNHSSVCALLTTALIVLFAISAYSQEELSIYGEAQAVDASANSITVQYYDYDSDEEKTMDVVSSKDTKIENAASLGEIKKGDWIDVTYSVSEGKNVAKSIIVEKEEGLPAEAPLEGTMDEE